jgi:hypothetical protein
MVTLPEHFKRHGYHTQRLARFTTRASTTHSRGACRSGCRRSPGKKPDPTERIQLAANPLPSKDVPVAALHNSPELRQYPDVPKTGPMLQNWHFLRWCRASKIVS